MLSLEMMHTTLQTCALSARMRTDTAAFSQFFARISTVRGGGHVAAPYDGPGSTDDRRDVLKYTADRHGHGRSV